jgi:excisionase family DNA binding protein
MSLRTSVSTPAAGSSTNEKLTVRELCAELKVSRSTFYDWRQKGVGPQCIRRPNGGLRIRRRDLDEWLGAREVR